MVDTNIGLDISSYQPDSEPGSWAFVFVKATESNDYVSDKAAAQFAWAETEPVRGLYHYARPLKSSAEAQAAHFIDTAHKLGFRVGTDLWALDVEGGGNVGVGGQQWASFVLTFMAIVGKALGAEKGFLYVGRFFYAAELLPLARRFHWWLPDYARNDGQPHPLPAGVVPVLHQFTSLELGHSLDASIVYDPEAWAAIIGAAAPTPAPNPAPEAPQSTEDEDMEALYHGPNGTVYWVHGGSVDVLTDMKDADAVNAARAERHQPALTVLPVQDSLAKVLAARAAK